MLASIWHKAAKTNSSFYTALIVLLSILACSVKSHAQGDLLIFPKRLVFDGPKKTQELNLANTGRDTARYLISVVQIRMKEDGKFENITTPDSGQNFADKYFRFFPRSVTLAPNEAQMVKVQLVKTNEMIPGEYRSHIYFRAERERKPLGEDEMVKDTTSITVSLTPIFGISIPLIIKVGTSNTKASVSNMSLTRINDTIPALQVKINRSGNMSIYGDIAINHVATNGQVSNLGLIQGVAVYTPTSSRMFTIALDKSKGVNLQSGKLQMMYTDHTNKKIVIAKEELVLDGKMMAIAN